MTENSLSKSAILMAAIVAIVLVAWEINLRSNGIHIAYDDGPPLWADKRAMVYEPSDKAVVFIGSSRIKYDLDIPTWENMTSCHAIQLAVEGSSPRPALEDLANDSDFKGRLIVDVTEGLFFTDDESSTQKNVKYFHDRTPAQRASFQLNRVLESGLVFLDKDNFSLNAQLDALEIPSREDVFMMPIFPLDFGRVSFDRQNRMTDRFVADTNIQNRMKDIWYFFHRFDKEGPAMPDSALTAIFQKVKDATDKIKAHGGEVLFVRTPATNYPGETRFPREKYWDGLLAFTQCPGIHYADYPGMNHLVCPEMSHLTPKDAVTFTKQFIEILEKEKGWKFSDRHF
ncbi:MAG: hypothetical protein H7246_08390 [Phycisphaerae bacterium]|nr:hypothetical protein [Saprospiraceae bacterium]